MLVSANITSPRLDNEMVATLGMFMNKPKNDGWFGSFDRWLDKQSNARIEGYVKQYATSEDEKNNKDLERRIRWEVGRRAETGKQLDIYEPLRWTGIRAVLGTLGAAATKMIEARSHNKTDKKYYQFIEIGIISGTAISSAIDLLRLIPRWLAGLEGGKNTALKLHREFAQPTNDQAFSPPPLPKEENKELAHAPAKKESIKPVSLLERAEHDQNSLSR